MLEEIRNQIDKVLTYDYSGSNGESLRELAIFELNIMMDKLQNSIDIVYEKLEQI